MTREQFIGQFENWDNYKVLLWAALEATEGSVIEMGIGTGSTEILNKYCADNTRLLFSYESNADWYDQFKHFDDGGHVILLVQDWNLVDQHHDSCGVLFVDHAPGERRHIDVQLFANKAKIIVIHDSEPEATGYMLDKVWHLFKYRKDFKTNGAWTTAISNFIDVTKWEI